MFVCSLCRCFEEADFEEANRSRYSIHPGSTRMYHDLREVFLWEGLKKDIEEFVSKFPNFQQVKV